MNAKVLHNSVGMPLLQEVDESVSVWVFMCLCSHYSYERAEAQILLLLCKAALFSILQTSDDM